MSDANSPQPKSKSVQFAGLWNAVILGVFVVVAAACHAFISSSIAEKTSPLHVDTVIGDISVRSRQGVSHLKCNGFKIECYESFVVIYVDKEKEPTWTGNYVLTYPWSKIEHLTMAGEDSNS